MTESKNDFPALACPICGIERKPRRLNKDGSISYSCPPDYIHHGNRHSWRIDVDGNLVEYGQAS